MLRPLLFPLTILIVYKAGSCCAAGIFEGKVCYITGGTSGLGKATAEASAKEGCKVVITGRRVEQGEKVVAEIKGAGGEAFFAKCDVSNPVEVEASIDATIKKYGSLDYAFNNAGLASPSEHTGGPHQITVDDWKKTIDVNLNGVFYSLKYEVSAMLKHNISGSIVNCGSIYSKIATATAGAYASSKHALDGLTKSAALAYAKNGIRVNNINPAFSPSELSSPLLAAEAHGARTVSGWHPAGRWLKNSEVVDGVHWLWSDKSSFYSGQDLVLDSGLTASWMPPDLFAAQVGAAAQKLGELQAATATAEKKEL